MSSPACTSPATSRATALPPSTPIGLKGVSHSMAMYYGYVAGKNALKDI